MAVNPIRHAVVVVLLAGVAGGLHGGWGAGASARAETPASGRSALDLLSGFDRQRLDGCFPPTDADSVGEVAKLLYRLRKLGGPSLQKRLGATRPAVADPSAGDSSGEPGDGQSVRSASVGDAARVGGTVQKIRRYQVPEKLVDVLEMKFFYELVLRSDPPEIPVSVMTPALSGSIQAGDRIDAVGVALSGGDSSLALAAPSVALRRSQMR